MPEEVGGGGVADHVGGYNRGVAVENGKVSRFQKFF